MQNVSQRGAAEAMPLANVESARFWRDSRFRDMECLSATFLTHEYAPHAHDTFSIGTIESGSQIATLSGRREETGPGDLYLIDPGVVHDGAPGGEGYRYRMIYPDMKLFVDILEDVPARPFMQRRPSPAGFHAIRNSPMPFTPLIERSRVAQARWNPMRACSRCWRRSLRATAAPSSFLSIRRSVARSLAPATT